MSDQQTKLKRESQTLFEPDPVLGRYVSHHPSNRVRLMIIGALIYMIPVGILQLVFWNIEDQLASIFLPVIYAIIAGGVLWYVLHHWNREVVLYERGFSFRQGSATAYILYSNVVRLNPRIERNAFLGFTWTVYDYTLVTDVDETLKVTNLYSNIERLTRALEAYITRDRLPIMIHKIEHGDSANFSDVLRLTAEGIVFGDRELFWHEFKGQRVKDAHLIIQSHDDDNWARIPVIEINNPVLLITMLKSRGKLPQTAV